MSRPRTLHLISLIVAANISFVTVSGVMAQQVTQQSRRQIFPSGFLPGSNMSSNMSEEPFTGSPLFLPVETYATGGTGIPAIAIGDLNGDGKPDLIVTNSCASCARGFFPTTDGVLGVLFGNGNGTFRPVVVYDSGGVAPTSVAIEDLNGDGKLDLAIANECNPTDCDYGTVTVLLGRGDGTFEPAMTYKSGGFERGPEDAVAPSIAIGDVNGDGKPDLVSTCWSQVAIFIGVVGLRRLVFSSATETAHFSSLPQSLAREPAPAFSCLSQWQT
ncbi:MAG: VCBS repeat-containing protein [Candidatus Sulfotelmatobacter sp.]